MVKGDYLIMLDEAELGTGYTNSYFDLHVISNGVTSDTTNQKHSFTGKYGVNMDVKIVYPTGVTQATSSVDIGGVDSKKLSATSNSASDDWFTILDPLKSGESSMAVSAYGGVAQGSYKLTKGINDDYLFLNPSEITVSSNGIAFTGKVGLINKTEGKQQMTIMNGSTIASGTKGIDVETAGQKMTAIFHDDKCVTGEYDGLSSSYVKVRLGFTVPSSYKVYIDGSSTATTWSAVTNGVRFQISSGKHTFKIVDTGLAATPSNASGMTATNVSPDEIKLAWTDNATNETEYVIERKIGSGTYSVIARLGANTTSYRDFGVIPNTSYTYKVSAKNNYGTAAGATATLTSMKRVPDAPTGLSLSTSNQGVTVTWTDNNNNENFYVIERRDGGVDVINVNTTARYVKMQGITRVSSSGYYQISELEVYAPSPSYKLNDNFEDGTATDWTTAGGGTWSVVTDGSYVYKQTGTSVEYYATPNNGSTTWTDYSLSARVKVNSNASSSHVGIMGRYVDANNYYYMRLDKSNNKVQLYKKVGGTSTQLFTADFTVSSSKWYLMKLTFSGSTIKGEVDGIQMFSVTDTSLTQGSVGLRMNRLSASYDDIKTY